MMKNTDLFADLSKTMAQPLFEQTEYPWEVLPKIKEFVTALGKTLPCDEYTEVAPQVWIHTTCKVYPSANISGPTIICEGTEVRPGAFIRGSVLVGKNCVVGNSTELKNCILFDNVQVPHYNYVGDSIFGNYSHTGAGAICSNVKSDKTLVVVHNGEEQLPTGLKKFAAVLGDHVEVGCNSVLCPGTVIGPNSNVYPLSRVRGVIPPNSIYKDEGNIVPKH
ncbi:MAG: UDP-N-acetylglucosamine pyrophosphorylase [Clostridia bacterium]|nr:UDP-N-acetylglucosamine pyrophosphorylase [Clostridia bacterium]